MCRHLAAVNDADCDPSWLLFDAPHSLRAQARHPRHQTSGPDNPDGWGVAWYPPGAAEPERYRSVVSIWDDDAFVSRAASLRCRALIAAARLASPGAELVETGNAPFVSGQWSFSLNGYVADFRAGAGDALRARVDPARLRQLEGDTDSEVLFALALDRIGAGAEPDGALAEVIALVTEITKGRLNLLLTDGSAVYATAYGNSLFHLGSGLVASEPLDDQPAWRQLRDESRWRFDGAAVREASL